MIRNMLMYILMDILNQLVVFLKQILR